MSGDAKIADVDRGSRIWTIPALTKTGKTHKVPLSDAALAVFDNARALARKSEFAFPNDVTGARLPGNAMLVVFERLGRKGSATVHGFRSTFRTWAQEQTGFPWELAEMSLGHIASAARSNAPTLVAMPSKSASQLCSHGQISVTDRRMVTKWCR